MKKKVNLSAEQFKEHLEGNPDGVIGQDQNKCELCDNLVGNTNLAYCDSCQEAKEKEE